MKEREKIASRLGFILISAGCAIGLGNVWRFPYITGKYGGAAFVLVYILFLVILAFPIIVMEFAVGRASRRSAIQSFKILEPKGTKWHLNGYASVAGNYLLMMYYTTICGWMMAYFYKMAKGVFVGLDPEQTAGVFSNMLANPGEMTFWMLMTVGIGFFICSKGLQNGVEKVSKFMMTALIILMLILAVRSVTLEGGMEGLKFYLAPDMSKMMEHGLFESIYAAMGQAFFTLSVGIGALSIFGSYIDKERSLTGEALCIMGLDTTVAFTAGLIIFPACFAFGVDPAEGPGLVFVTLPNVFNQMPGGRLWGALFFIFMSFAALSTVIAVFENIICFGMDLWGWSRKKATIFNIILIPILSMPCLLGMNVWSDFKILGLSIDGFEDFLVSDNLLPLGSLVYLLFCVSRYGWGWDNFIKEADSGTGMKFPKAIRGYLTVGLPLIILFVCFMGYKAKFFS